MRGTLDPLHNQNHVYSILDSLSEFLDQNAEVKLSRIDFDALLPAICWHDIWKSTKNPAKKRAVIFHNVAEGIGSMRLFSRYAARFPLTLTQTSKIKYAIRKHSSFQILPKRTLEARILYDLDSLELWSFPRILQAVEKLGGIEKINPSLFFVAKFYFDHWMMKKTGSRMYFEWSRKKFQVRRRQFLQQASEMLSVFIHNRFSFTHPTTSSLFPDRKSNQLSSTRSIILNGASKIKSKTNTRKFSFDTPRLSQLPTATIGSISISPTDEPKPRPVR